MKAEIEIDNYLTDEEKKEIAIDVLSENNNNIELFAEKTGISLKQAKKLSRCGYDGHSLSKMIDIMIKLGYYPVIEFKKLDELLIKK